MGILFELVGQTASTALENITQRTVACQEHVNDYCVIDIFPTFIRLSLSVPQTLCLCVLYFLSRFSSADGYFVKRRLELMQLKAAVPDARLAGDLQCCRYIIYTADCDSLCQALYWQYQPAYPLHCHETRTQQKIRLKCGCQWPSSLLQKKCLDGVQRIH